VQRTYKLACPFQYQFGTARGTSARFVGCTFMRMPGFVQGLLRTARHRPSAGGGEAPLQVAALPYRRRSDGTFEVMLVTSRGTGSWILPKGWPMAGKTLAEAAAQEAYEEAGVRGVASPDEIGRFAHSKSQLLAEPLHCEVAVFPMAVEQELEVWPERRQRTRAWFAVDEAAAAVKSPALARIIRSAGWQAPSVG